MSFLNAIIPFLNPIGVLFALGAAIASWFAAFQTRRVAQGRLVSSLLDSYSSRQVHDSILQVCSWDPKERILPGTEIDHARRQAAHYFLRVIELRDARLLERRLLTVVINRDQAAFCCLKVEPLEAQVNPHYKKAPFDRIANLYGGRKNLHFA